MELRDVAYVPSIIRNLISVSILDRCGFTFHFGNGHVSLYCNSLLVGSSTLSDGLYMVVLHSDFGGSSSQVPNANVVVGSKRARLNEKSSMLWHKRLGHISRERIQRLIKDDILHDLDFSDFGTCIECIMVKLTAKTRKERLLEVKRFLSLFTLIYVGLSLLLRLEAINIS